MKITVPHPETGEDWLIDVDFTFHKGYPASYGMNDLYGGEPGMDDEYIINEVVDVKINQLVDWDDFEQDIIDELESIQNDSY